MITIWNKTDLSIALNQNINFDGGKISMNSADIKPGEIFIALQGKTDGHSYVAKALEKGASFAIVSYMPSQLSFDEQKKVVIVDNTYQALLNLAKYRRNQSSAQFIAITGSSGKTSTKEHLFSILSAFGKTFATEGNFNNHLGVPLTLASIPLDVKYVIIEIAMNQKGEIKPLAEMVKPDIAVVTNILPAHIGNFQSIEEIAFEKSQVFQGPIHKSVAIIHHSDNQQIFEILKNSAIQHGIKTILLFGERGCDINLLHYELINKNCAQLKVNIGGIIYNIKTQLIGRHNAFNLMAIILVAACLDLNLDEVVSNIERCEQLKGRGQIISVDNFSKKFSIIDDAYNANPGSMQAALANIASISSSQKVAILGDMLELGSNSISFHKNLKTDLEKAGICKFIAIGELMQHLYNSLGNDIEKYYFADYKQLNQQIASIIKNDDLILIKGSKGMQLGEVVKYLIAEG